MSDLPDDVVTVDIDGRAFLMARAEADALTDEMRATIVAKAETLDEVKEAERRTRAAAENSAREAAAEEGRVVVQVWCGECDEATEPVADVRESSAGLVFQAWRRLEMDGEPGDLVSRMRSGRSGREPFLAPGGTSVLLEESTEAPAATCTIHGSGYLDTAELLGLANAHGGGDPVRMYSTPGR